MTAVGNAELFTVAPDEISLTFVTAPHESVTTCVGPHEVTTTGPYHVARVTGLEPDTPYALKIDGAESSELLPAEVRTLARPPGRLLATVGTVNDVHFGEVECGRLGEGEQLGPLLAVRARRTAVPRRDEPRRDRRAAARSPPTPWS